MLGKVDQGSLQRVLAICRHGSDPFHHHSDQDVEGSKV